MRHNGLRTVTGRAVHRGARGGYQPDWVHVTREPSDWVQSATSGLYRDAYLTGQPTTFDSAFFAMRVRYVPRNHRKRYFWGYSSGSGYVMFNVGGSSTADPAGKSGVNSTGKVINVPPPTAYNFAGNTGYDVQSEGREFIWAFSVNGSTGAMHTAIFEYGWQVWTSGYVTGGVDQNIAPVYPSLNMDLDCDYWRIFGENYGFQGDAAYVWFRASDDTASFVDLTDKANLAMLQDNPEDWTFATPLVWFQGNAAEWNSGVNRGTGGDFTLTSQLTDVVDNRL
jgi:hypothetical protein